MTIMVPIEPKEPTEQDKLWELFWAVNSWSGTPDEENYERVEEVMRWLSDWLHANSTTAE